MGRPNQQSQRQGQRVIRPRTQKRKRRKVPRRRLHPRRRMVVAFLMMMKEFSLSRTTRRRLVVRRTGVMSDTRLERLAKKPSPSEPLGETSYTTSKKVL